MQNRVIVIFVICLFKSVINATIYADPLKIALEEFLADATIEIVPCQSYSTACYDTPCQYGFPTYPGCPVSYDFLSCPCGMPLYPWAPIYDPPSCCCQYPQCGCQYRIPPPPMCTDYCCQCGPYPPPCEPCDFCPSCSCYRDSLNPCAVYEDASSTYICFNNYGCDCSASPAPCIYFPEVEYPVTVRDMKPYYCGSCWCS